MQQQQQFESPEMTATASMMRKTIIVILSIVFTGALLLYTGQANLDLLMRVSPNPQFVGFAMLALEGGVIYWTGYYLLHWHGVHKGIAIVMIFVDFLFSMVGFFADENMIATSRGLGTSLADWFPHVILIVAADITINVFVGIVVHLFPDHREVQAADFRPLLRAVSAMKQRIESGAARLAQEATIDVPDQDTDTTDSKKVKAAHEN